MDERYLNIYRGSVDMIGIFLYNYILMKLYQFLNIPHTMTSKYNSNHVKPMTLL